MKLGLGTVQFGVDYGISNTNGQTSLDEAQRIVDYAAKQGIDTIDTAPESYYGESEVAVGKVTSGCAEFNIITKTERFVDIPEIQQSDADQFEKVLNVSLSRLKKKSVYGVLVHNVRDLMNPGSDLIYQKLLDFKNDGKTKKIGVSVYDAEQIDYILDNYQIDLIQLPCSIFDQRLIKSGHLKKLKDHGVEIHVRSAFLQGLVFMETGKLSKHFDKAKPILNKFHIQLTELSITPAQAALAFLDQIPEIDKIICGVNNLDQFKELVESIKCNIDMNWASEFSIDDDSILNPGNWK